MKLGVSENWEDPNLWPFDAEMSGVLRQEHVGWMATTKILK
jgi:hypothetical protein